MKIVILFFLFILTLVIFYNLSDLYEKYGVDLMPEMRSTRNMSYDLRGDVPIPYHMIMPFNMSTRMPIINAPP